MKLEFIRFTLLLSCYLIVANGFLFGKKKKWEDEVPKLVSSQSVRFHIFTSESQNESHSIDAIHDLNKTDRTISSVCKANKSLVKLISTFSSVFF
jgi:hypothetical protein